MGLGTFDRLRCVMWIRDYFETANKKTAVIGISGGIDSAIVAALCVDALGKENVIGVVLPIYSAVEDCNDAVALIKNLGIQKIFISLQEVYNQWFYSFRSALTLHNQLSKHQFNAGDTIDDELIIKGNAKARLRMLTLYGIAGAADGLVVGTTNKSEEKIGYSTKYGDGGVDLEPIMDFYKTEIYELVKYYPAIPKEIVEKAPSAGLWAGQTDEEEIGMSYGELDSYLERMENNWANSWDLKKLDKIETMIRNSRHKDLHLPYFKRKE